MTARQNTVDVLVCAAANALLGADETRALGGRQPARGGNAVEHRFVVIEHGARVHLGKHVAHDAFPFAAFDESALISANSRDNIERVSESSVG